MKRIFSYFAQITVQIILPQSKFAIKINSLFLRNGEQSNGYDIFCHCKTWLSWYCMWGTNCFKYCLHFISDEHILEFKTLLINAFEVSNDKTAFKFWQVLKTLKCAHGWFQFPQAQLARFFFFYLGNLVASVVKLSSRFSVCNDWS